MTDISALEKFFRSTVIAIEAVESCIGADPAARSFNSVAPGKTAFPYHVFQVIPLNDNTGQARISIQSRFLVDSKILSTFPVDETVDAAVDAIKEYFRTAAASFDSEGYRIPVRHERPISFIEPGSTADERILHRGGTYRVWMHKTS